MTQPNQVLIGDHVELRNIETNDLDDLRKWRNRPKCRQYFREYRDITPEMQLKWYTSAVCADPRVQMFAITDKRTKKLLGACGLCYLDERNSSADFSIYIGADELYIDDIYAPDAGRLLLQYGFDILALHRIWAEIYATDLAKQALLPKLGFVLDGCHREAHRLETGDWTDCLFYGLLASNFDQ